MILDSDPRLRDSVMSLPFMQHIIALVNERASPELGYSVPPLRPTHTRPISLPRRPKNVDLAVLRPDHQTLIHVTPLIDDLARGLFHEPLQVIGPPTKRHTSHDIRQRQHAIRQHVLQLVSRLRAGVTQPRFPEGRSIPANGDYWEAVHVGDVLYRVSPGTRQYVYRD